MATTPLEFKPKLAEFLLSEAAGQLSRENILVTQDDAEVLSGTLLTKGDATVTATGGVYAADGGNAGNFTASAVVVDADAAPGVYQIDFTAATKFRVENAAGVLIGTGTLGTEFDKGGVTFTLTAGVTPAVAGDSATITVAATTITPVKYVPYEADGAAGPAHAILYNYLPSATGDVQAVAFVRQCEVNRFALTGLDAAAEADLETRGIIVRGRDL